MTLLLFMLSSSFIKESVYACCDEQHMERLEDVNVDPRRSKLVSVKTLMPRWMRMVNELQQLPLDQRHGRQMTGVMMQPSLLTEWSLVMQL